MVSRGEIEFFIASPAESKGMFHTDRSSGETAQDEATQIFHVVVWAITLCTIIGPWSVGTLVRRVTRLRGQQHAGNGPNNFLGIWDIS